MTPTTSSLPARLQHAEAPQGDIDARIRQAELRLISREENLHRGVTALGQRLREAARPHRLIVPLAGAVVLVLGWWWRRSGTGARPLAPAPAPRGSGPWMGLLGLVVPLLPQKWRARFSPAIVSAVMAIGGLVLDKLRKRPPTDRAPSDRPVDVCR